VLYDRPVDVTPERAAEGRSEGSLRYGWWPWALLVVGIGVAVSTPFVVAGSYGADLTWPALATSFSSTCLAFLVALAWDRRQRSVADRNEHAAELRRQDAERRAAHERRKVEATRRLAAIAIELERIEASLRRTVAEQHRYKYFFPDLPTGSWNASSEPLGLIIADYGLIADLSTFYGQVEEMRWRLRFKASAGVDDAEVSPLVDGLARALLADVVELRDAVAKQRERPEVESDLVEPESGRPAGRRQLTETIRVLDLAPTAAATREPPT
jgi:hypothetical protein